MRVAWALTLHVGVPALIAWLPTTTGMRLRDFADFYPEQVAVAARASRCSWQAAWRSYAAGWARGLRGNRARCHCGMGYA